MNLRRLALAGFSLLSTVSFSQDFNYGEALQKSLFFYEAQQSGELPDWNRVSWRADSTINDGSDVGLDLNGGWFDAGDHVKFNFPMAFSVTALAWGAIEYSEAYEKAGQLEIIKRNLRFVTDYFIKCHVAPNELYGQVGNGSLDHGFWGAPEVYTPERPSYKIDEANPGSDLAAETAAALSAVSILFQDDDPAYSAILIEHAKELYSFADNFRGEYSSSITDAAGFYNSFSSYQDELVWGAAWLYRATNETEYLAKAESEYSNLQTEGQSSTKSYKFTSSWDDKAYSSYVLLSQLTNKDEYKADSERFLDYWTVGVDGEKVPYSPGGQAHLIQWGSLRYAANTSFLAFVYSDKVISGTDKAVIYHDFAVGQTNYALGDNPINRSFMVGFGNNPANNVHHRGAHGPWANSLESSPDAASHVLYGALAGGPSAADDQFEDDRGDFIANEVACDYNACFTGSLIRMYSEFGGEPLVDFPQVEEPTRAELRSLSKFNSNTQFGSTVSVMYQNRSAWPARTTDNITMRYFFDITEAVEENYTIDDVAVTLSYAQYDEASINIYPWDEENNVYYAEISLLGAVIAPTGDPDFRSEVQIQITANNIPYDTSNDWSAQGLTDEAVESSNIPVYDNGVLVFGNEAPGGDTPKAVFTASTESGFAPLVVDFDASESSDPNGDDITYLWVFGNGETSTMVNPTITFDEIGSFEVSLTVSDGVNTSAAYTTTITTEDPNVAPVAVINASATAGIAPFVIDFDASESSDENGDSLVYMWGFEDGTSSTMETTSYTFTEVGEYEVSLTVSDGTKTDVEKIIITINDGSPVISYTSLITTLEAPFEVLFDASASEDPEGGMLTYSWDFGNGSSAGTDVTTAVYNENGDYTVVLTIINESGKESTKEFIISVGNSNCIFNTPLATALPSIDNKVFENVFVLGEDGPDLSAVNTFIINWNLTNNGLYQFSFNSSVNPTYVDFSGATQNFNSLEPEITIIDSGIAGLDGSYYVTIDEGNFVMVSKTEGFTLYFSTSTTEPDCPDNNTLSNPILNLANYDIGIFPNPASELVNVLVKTTEDLKDVEREIVITNLLGQPVKSINIPRGETLINFKANGLAVGIYLVQINVDGKQLKVSKLIIE